MSEDTYPFPDPLPRPNYNPKEIGGPKPIFGTSFWLNFINMLFLPITMFMFLLRYGTYEKDEEKTSRANATALLEYNQWLVKNHDLKCYKIDRMIEAAKIKEYEEESSHEISLTSLETKILNGWAEYQLKRDYWGEMDPEQLKAEYRTMVHQMPDVGILRASTDCKVIEIVGNLAALPPATSALPSSQIKESDRLWRIRYRLEQNRPDIRRISLENHEILVRFSDLDDNGYENLDWAQAMKKSLEREQNYY